MADSLYCALASNSLSFGSAGGSRPCCAVDTYFWQERKHMLGEYDSLIKWFNNDDMVALRQKLLDGQWDPICNMCRVREEHGQASTRQIFNKTMADLEERTGKDLKETTAVATDLSKIFLLDITVGNKCNSACLMCNESASSLWAKEQEAIRGIKMHWIAPNWFSEQRVPELIDNLPNLSTIQFVGGEPTISDAHIALLKRLVSRGRASEISLGYVTNLTGISDELLELWSHFGNKHITISVDGVGPINDYIRYPFSWKKVESQIAALKNIADSNGGYHIGLSHTVISLNLLTIDSLLAWWEDQVGSSSSMLTALPHIQCVNNPDFFNPLYMSRTMKEEARKSLARVSQMALDRNLGDKYTPIINNITTTVLNTDVPEEVRVKQWLKMQNFIAPLDSYRNRNIFDYIPYMKEYWIDE